MPDFDGWILNPTLSLKCIGREGIHPEG